MAWSVLSGDANGPRAHARGLLLRLRHLMHHHLVGALGRSLLGAPASQASIGAAGKAYPAEAQGLPRLVGGARCAVRHAALRATHDDHALLTASSRQKPATTLAAAMIQKFKERLFRGHWSDYVCAQLYQRPYPGVNAM